MKRLVPVFVFIVIILVFFRPLFLQNLLPIPSDTIVGLYNPFRDLYAVEYPRGIPFKNFLITDPVRQQYPWRFESILQEKIGQLPLWNPYNFAGAPLLANQQSAGLTPFNIVFFVLPFPYAWSILILLQPLLAGLFFYIYIRNKKIYPLASLFGSVAFVFSGFFVAWLEWGTVDSVIMWLPLLLLCLDKAFQERKKLLWYGMFTLALILSFVAGHLQTFFYVSLVSLAYFCGKVIIGRQRGRHILFAVGAFVIFLVITFVQWMPLLQLIVLSARDSDLTMTPGWFIPVSHLIMFFVPDFFGNPTTLNYWGVWNYAELIGYIGIPGLLFAFFTLFQKQTKTTIFFLITTLVALLFALPTPLASLALHIPLLATAQPTRLLAVIDFSLCILATYGLHQFFEQKSKAILFPIGLFTIIFAAIWSVVLFHTKFLPLVSFSNIVIAKHNLVLPTVLFAITGALILGALFLKKQKTIFLALIICIFLVSVFDNLRFAEKFTPFTNSAYLFPQTKTLTYLETHAGIERVMETDSQILPPNFSLIYHVQSVDGYDPLYIKTYGELLAALGRDKPDIHTPFGFNRLLTPQNYQSRLVDLLGVKYVLSLENLTSPKLTKVLSEGQTTLYENKQVYPRAFFVEHVLSMATDQESVNFLFDTKNNLRNSAVIVGSQGEQAFSSGTVNISSYEDNKVALKTNNAGDGFLVLTDSYYPTWHAYIDGKETPIYRTDLALRGIVVPKGTHIIIFSVQL